LGWNPFPGNLEAGPTPSGSLQGLREMEMGNPSP